MGGYFYSETDSIFHFLSHGRSLMAFILTKNIILYSIQFLRFSTLQNILNLLNTFHTINDSQISPIPKKQKKTKEDPAQPRAFPWQTYSTFVHLFERNTEDHSDSNGFLSFVWKLPYAILTAVTERELKISG